MEKNALPLLGKKILVTRAAGQSGQFTSLLEANGAHVIEMPTLEIRPPSSWDDLDRAIASLSNFNWLILTSSNAVDYLFDRLSVLNFDLQIFAQTKIAVVGKKTAESLQARGLLPDFIPPDFIADSLAVNFPDNLANCRILFPRVETGGRAVLVQELTAKGADVVEVAAYESGCPEKIDPAVWEAIENRDIDMITFASSKTVKNFCYLIEKAYFDRYSQSKTAAHIITAWGEQGRSILLASIGPETSKTCQTLLGKVDIEAQEFTLEGLTTAIINY